MYRKQARPSSFYVPVARLMLFYAKNCLRDLRWDTCALRIYAQLLDVQDESNLLLEPAA